MWKIIYKDRKHLENLRTSWKYLTELLYIIYEKVQPGISWNELESIAQEYMDKNNIKWAFKWFMWFPANLCISINDCVVHWRPSWYKLKKWDLVKIDAWVIYKWAISDSAFSKIVWWRKYNEAWYELIKSTKQALDAGIWTLEVWWNFYRLWKTIFNTMKKNWFSVIKNLTWHWVWTEVHEPPHIYNYPNKELKQITVKDGMAFAIEPITAEQSSDFIEETPWAWELLCEKWDLWAQWEYTLAVIDNKIEVISWIQEDLFDKE